MAKRRKATIHVLPGVERRDLGEAVASREVLEEALEQGVTDVVVIGRDRLGELYFSSADGDVDRVVGKVLRMATWLAGSNVERDDTGA